MDKSHPYSPALSAGDYVFVSGALSVNAAGVPVPVEQPEHAIHTALERLDERLATGGVTLEHVVQMVYYTTDISYRELANLQFADNFREPRPARSFVQVAALPYGATVEIEAIAYVRPVREKY